MYPTFIHNNRFTYQLNGITRPQYCGLIASLKPGSYSLSKPYHLYESEVVTRFPQTNLNKYHYYTVDPRY